MDIHTEKLAYCGKYFKTKGLKLVLAESMTAGFLGLLFSLEKYSGDYFLGSIVCYHDDMKKQILNIDEQLLSNYGGVSAEVTNAMIKGLEQKYSADVSIAVTGFASECKETNEESPVGTVYVDISFENMGLSKKCQYHGSPQEIIQKTAHEIIEDLYEMIH